MCVSDRRNAGRVMVHKAQVRLERYGLGFDVAGRWTSFSVATEKAGVHGRYRRFGGRHCFVC